MHSLTMRRNLNRDDDSKSQKVHTLLLEFVDLGRRLKLLKDSPGSDSMSEHDHIMRRVRDVADSVVRLSETMDPHNEYLQIFSAGALLASDITNDPELEKCLMALSCKVSKRMLE